uniref:hypothetical protein n=1 Tax=Dubosiella newyorkensis TaxID=1862672 RepID=UPI00272D9C34
MAKLESKSSADYWREREEEQRKHNIQEEKAYSQEIERDSEFLIDYIKVWQNENYEQYIIDDSKFPGGLDMKN